MNLIERMKSARQHDLFSIERYENIPIFKYKLLIKVHWETGINYLCVTKQKDWFKYKGSGQRWKKLLTKIPSKIFTSLLYTTDCVEDLSKQCWYYSDLFDIPNNRDFANVIPELGYVGNQGNLPYWWTIATDDQKQITLDKRKVSREKTCIERYGIDNTLGIAREKLKDTLSEMGFTSAMQIPEIKEKNKISRTKTLMEVYGVEHNMQISEVAQKVKQARQETLYEKHGVLYATQISEVAQRAAETRTQTMIERYGVSNISMCPEYKERISKSISEALNKREYKKCSFCDYESKSISSHEKYCNHNPNREHMELIECPHCGKKCNKSNAKRWHFDNCKENKNGK